jgi:hypothetical protein
LRFQIKAADTIEINLSRQGHYWTHTQNNEKKNAEVLREEKFYETGARFEYPP